MTDRINTLLVDLKAGFRDLYGHRLKGLYLFGSYARGEETADSDVDVIVVLDHVGSYGAEINRTGPLVSAVSLDFDVSIGVVLVSEAAWAAPDTVFLANVREDAVAT